MPSPFYNLRFKAEIPFSFLLIERISELMVINQERGLMDEELFATSVKDAISDCTGITATEKQLLDIANRMRKLVEESKPKEDKPEKPSKGFAAGYVEWVSKLDPAETCLLATNFNFAEAERLYSELDRTDVLALIETKIGSDWENIKVNYESSVYAFGGDPEGGGSADKGEIREFDMTKPNAPGLAALKKML